MSHARVPFPLAACAIAWLCMLVCSCSPSAVRQRDESLLRDESVPRTPAPPPSEPASAAGAATASPTDAPSGSGDAAREVLVALVGASVTAGFVCPWSDEGEEANRAAPLATALRAVWPDPSVSIRAAADSATSWDRSRQDRLVAGLARQDPDLVVGVDFMFWFGYGVVRGPEIPARMQLQDEGFALLERFGTTPIVLGDYPDVRGADARMIAPRQIPSPAALDALGARLARWADARPHVHLFDLSARFRAMRERGLEVPGAGRSADPIPGRFVLQTDRLHPRRLGTALLAHRLSARLGELDVPGLPAPRTAFAPIVEACRAAGDLELALDAMAAAGSGDGR